MTDELENNGTTDSTDDTDLMADAENKEELQETMADADSGGGAADDSGGAGGEVENEEDSSEEEAV